MKVFVVDETRKRREMIVEGLTGQGHTVSGISTSNQLMTEATENKPELMVIDLDSWNKGKVIYNYFNLLNMLENVPLVIYNAEEGVTSLDNRARHANDHILYKPTDVSTLLETVQGI